MVINDYIKKEKLGFVEKISERQIEIGEIVSVEVPDIIIEESCDVSMSI